MVFTAVIWEEVYYPFVSIILHPPKSNGIGLKGRKESEMVSWSLIHSDAPFFAPS